MGLHSHANQRDGNEPEIVEFYKKRGASVWRTDTPFDLVVGLVVGAPGLVKELRARHSCGVTGGVPYCEMCTDLEVMPWPCDVIRAVEVIEWLSGPRTFPVEVKSEKGKLTPLQQRFYDQHRGDYYITRSLEAAADQYAQWTNTAIFSKACR